MNWLNKPSHLAGLVFVVIMTAVNSHAQSFLTNGLVAYYPFTGNANDASGNGNNGTVHGATLTADRFGTANSAYSFNGVGSYVGFSTVPLNQTGNWTVTAWIQPATTNQLGQAVTVGYDNGTSATANGFAFDMAGQTSGQQGNQLIGVFGGIASLDSGYFFASSNQWYHIVMLQNAGITEFFVNGVQTAETQTGVTPRTPTALTIGSANGTRFFNGSINDVRIYNLALSSNEVQQLYQYEAGSLNIQKAVYLNTYNLFIGSNYQFQASSDLTNWINQGPVFTATNTYWQSTNYYQVADWNQLFFRLLPQ